MSTIFYDHRLLLSYFTSTPRIFTATIFYILRRLHLLHFYIFYVIHLRFLCPPLSTSFSSTIFYNHHRLSSLSSTSTFVYNFHLRTLSPTTSPVVKSFFHISYVQPPYLQHPLAVTSSRKTIIYIDSDILLVD